MCHLGISALAYRFGMLELQLWSRSQLELVFKSVTRFVNSNWDKDTLLQAMNCANRRDDWLAGHMRNFVWLALSTSAPNNPLLYQRPRSSNLDTCVALYKDPDLPEKYPGLFGYIFTIVLSLGHRSSVWTSQLTREDRHVLYTAQAHLISIRDESDLDLSWLSRPPSQNWGFVCNSCADHIDTAWGASLAGCANLDSIIPLEDISKLVLLPSYGQLFVDLIWSNPRPCTNWCNQTTWATIENRMRRVFLGMYSKYNYFVE